ncbi:MAG: ATPase, central domain protein [Nocardia sp.]|uniref:ATP-binding protein n=1 Tax=Nocardia sp. TaxID=1821 RepID=UPI0026251A1B|nr:AAA family ATPase [Nocardia sp.]MCU1640581.1 ATPase, central domain protein [Nocardia sp.]
MTASFALRRTLRFEGDLDDARAAQTQVLVTGAGVNDILIDRDGRALRLQGAFHSYCVHRELGLVVYRLGAGATTLPTLPDGSAVTLRLPGIGDGPAHSIAQILAELRTCPTPAVFVLDFADSIVPAAQALSLEVSLLIEHLRAVTQEVSSWQRRGMQLVIVDRGGGISPRLASQPGIRTVHLGAPDQDESTLFINKSANAQNRERLYLHPDLSVAEAGRLTRGLLNLTVHERRLISSPEAPLTAAQITEVKSAAIRQLSQGTLELMPDRLAFGADVAGLPSVRLHLHEMQLIGQKTVRVLLSGPPGTGKTLCATAIGALLQVPVVRFASVLNQFLGVSESNMDRALHVLRELAPLVLFIDEADQRGLGNRGHSTETHETYQNLRAMLFEFLGDTGADNGISVVATTNVPARLDEAVRSRFTVLPVLFPSGPELAQIMAIHARRNGIPLQADLKDQMTGYVADGHALSGRSAPKVLTKAWIRAHWAHRDEVSAADVEEALADYVGDDWTPAAEYSTLTSILAVDNADAWPWVAAQRLNEEYDTPGALTTYLRPDGKVDTLMISDRITELEKTSVYR